MQVLADVLMCAVGLVLIVAVGDSAIRTFVLPRGVVSFVTRSVFQSVGSIFRAITRPMTTYAARDRAMALFAPVSLLALVFVWVALVVGGFTLLFGAVVTDDLGDAFRISGSSFFTLGFVLPPPNGGEWGYVFAFAEAGTGLAVLALLIAFLPTIYGAFSRRELAVARLAARAGTPPSAVELLVRYHEVGWLDDLPALWAEWENWFSELGETHTTFAMLAFFRSPNPDRSWVTSAGAVLDAAAIAQSALRVPGSPQAGMCIRSGYLALRDIAALYRVPFDADPEPDDPISIAKTEFLDAYEQLGGAGVPMRPDRERAWQEFAGWRVNYDAVLLALASITTAPYAPWSSDRSLSGRRRSRSRGSPRARRGG
jgi:hypothetical protein